MYVRETTEFEVQEIANSSLFESPCVSKHNILNLINIFLKNKNLKKILKEGLEP